MVKDAVKDQRLFAQACLKMIGKFSEYIGKGDVEMQALATFWTVAERGGEMPMMELQDTLGLSQSSVSRNVTLLSIGSIAAPGPRLLEAFDDPGYRRRKIVQITPRGRKLADELREICIMYVKKMGA